MSMRFRLTTLPEPPAALLTELTESAAAIAGMSPGILERRAVRQTVRRRLESTGHATVEAYIVGYRESEEERRLFLEGILNNETCFFRDAIVFTELRRWCLNWLATNQRAMRILSAPCSTGEEPYSLTAMLHEAGVPLERFSVDAIDLSRAVLELAERAEYTGLSLRNVPRPDEAHYLERGESGWRVKDHLRKQVRFRQGNLLEEDALDDSGYDLICSRNLMIYQTSEARRQVATALAKALHPQGRLVLGAADWGRDLEELFELEAPVNSFALRLRSPQTETALPVASGSPIEKATVTTAPLHRPARHVTTSNELAHITQIYRRALEAFAGSNEREAERLCRQSLYLDNGHLPSLELLNRIRRPNLTHRMQHALRARLRRHRAAVQGGAA